METFGNLVIAEFHHESVKSKCLSSNNGAVQWEVAYKSNKLHLSLLSGAASAEVRYFVRVEYKTISEKKTVFSCGSATIKKDDSTDLGMCFYESKNVFNQMFPIPSTTPSNAKTCFNLFILRLNPVVEIPQASTLFAVLSSTLETGEGLNDVMLYFGPGRELVQASKFMLMARSPVFKKMFEASMKEAESNEVTIDDITLAVGKEMITYIYTDEAPKYCEHGRKIVVCS